MTTVCFDTCYNKCTILFTDANLFMNDVLTYQLIGMGVTTKQEEEPILLSSKHTEKRNHGDIVFF